MPAYLKFFTYRWFQVLAVGTALFVGAEQALKLTGNLNFIPTVLILGASIVPVAFVAFFYSRERNTDRTIHFEAPLGSAVSCFFLGGVIGVVIAGFLEYATLRMFDIRGLFMVGVIEESAKLLVPIYFYWRASYLSQADGLLYGVASGMGFAALETMGYGLVTLLEADGNVGALEEILLVRGLFAPFGHAAWTGVLTAELWGQRARTKRLLGPGVIWMFILVVVLHATWDIASFSDNAAIAFPAYVIFGGVSLGLLINKLKESAGPEAK